MSTQNCVKPTTEVSKSSATEITGECIKNSQHLTDKQATPADTKITDALQIEKDTNKFLKKMGSNLELKEDGHLDLKDTWALQGAERYLRSIPGNLSPIQLIRQSLKEMDEPKVIAETKPAAIPEKTAEQKAADFKKEITEMLRLFRQGKEDLDRIAILDRIRDFAGKEPAAYKSYVEDLKCDKFGTNALTDRLTKIDNIDKETVALLLSGDNLKAEAKMLKDLISGYTDASEQKRIIKILSSTTVDKNKLAEETLRQLDKMPEGELKQTLNKDFELVRQDPTPEAIKKALADLVLKQTSGVELGKAKSNREDLADVLVTQSFVKESPIKQEVVDKLVRHLNLITRNSDKLSATEQETILDHMNKLGGDQKQELMTTTLFNGKKVAEYLATGPTQST